MAGGIGDATRCLLRRVCSTAAGNKSRTDLVT